MSTSLPDRAWPTTCEPKSNATRAACTGSRARSIRAISSPVFEIRIVSAAPRAGRGSEVWHAGECAGQRGLRGIGVVRLVAQHVGLKVAARVDAPDAAV